MILLWCLSWYLKYKATYLNILLESIMPKNQPAVETKNETSQKEKRQANTFDKQKTKTRPYHLR